MFKDSKIEFSDDTIVIADSGYQGLQKIHEKTLIPIKKSKNKPLNTKEKDFNKLISKIRVPVEHIFGWLKRFKILVHACRKSKYRLGLRFNLICALFNNNF